MYLCIMNQKIERIVAFLEFIVGGRSPSPQGDRPSWHDSASQGIDWA